MFATSALMRRVRAVPFWTRTGRLQQAQHSPEDGIGLNATVCADDGIGGEAMSFLVARRQVKVRWTVFRITKPRCDAREDHVIDEARPVEECPQPLKRRGGTAEVSSSLGGSDDGITLFRADPARRQAEALGGARRQRWGI